MLRYTLKRLAMAAVTIYVVVTLSFFMVRLMPGNAAAALQAQLEQQGGLSQAMIQAKVAAILAVAPKGPLWKQYLQYVANIFQGNFGTSLLNPGEKVLDVIAGAIPWTLFSVGLALIISFLIGLVLGTVMAAFQASWFSKVATFVTSVLSAVPNYVVALVLLYFLAGLHPFFPDGGAYGINAHPGLNGQFIASALYHAVLPVASYVIVAFGGWSLTMKGSVATIMGADYLRAAYSWGLSKRRVTQSYVGRNSMLPMVTNLALALGYMFGGSVFIETYFNYPGVGYYLIQSVDSRDYSVMMGCFILITSAVVLANLAVDLLYPLIDPRIASPAGAKRVGPATAEALPGPATVGGVGAV